MTMIQTIIDVQKVNYGHLSKFHSLIILRSRDMFNKPWAIRWNILDVVGSLITIQAVHIIWKIENGYEPNF